MANHVLRHGRLTDLDAKRQKFAVDSRRTPKRIRLRHRANQRADLGSYRRSALSVPTLPGPEQAEAPAMPREDGFRLYDDDCRSPSAPDA
jgi:hypothetical protein